MFTETTKITKFNVLMDSGCVETTTSRIVYRNGVEIARDNLDCCYMPTELAKFVNEVGAGMADEINYLTAKWSPEFIADYEAEVARLNPETEVDS